MNEPVIEDLDKMRATAKRIVDESRDGSAVCLAGYVELLVDRVIWLEAKLDIKRQPISPWPIDFPARENQVSLAHHATSAPPPHTSSAPTSAAGRLVAVE